MSSGVRTKQSDSGQETNSPVGRNVKQTDLLWLVGVKKKIETTQRWRQRQRGRQSSLSHRESLYKIIDWTKTAFYPQLVGIIGQMLTNLHFPLSDFQSSKPSVPSVCVECPLPAKNRPLLLRKFPFLVFDVKLKVYRKWEKMQVWVSGLQLPKSYFHISSWLLYLEVKFSFFFFLRLPCALALFTELTS